MTPRLAVVFYGVGTNSMFKCAVDFARSTSNPLQTQIVVVDNGSTEPIPTTWGDVTYRYEHTVGPNQLFHRWREDAWFGRDEAGGVIVPEFIAFLHIDLFVYEMGWDTRVIQAFDADPRLGLVGFVGSNEIDDRGGRGVGTVLNFQGRDCGEFGQASAAEYHGRRSAALEAAGVLDGCVMIFRTTVLETLTPWGENDPPFHFYDRVLCCEVLDNGSRVAYLGIEIDHLSGGIRGGKTEAHAMYRTWCDAHNIAYPPGGEEHAIYEAAEQLFFKRYRATRFFPFKILPNYMIIRG